MDHISIPIPEGLPDEQKQDLTGYLIDQVHAITGNGSAIDDDPQVRAEIVQRIKAGIEAGDAGRAVTSAEARRRLDAKLGLNRERSVVS